MEHMEPMDDREIQEKVESLAGKGTKVVDCEKSTSFESKEILLVNGYPVPLIGDEGGTIKRALLEGKIPSGDLLNQILIRAGILKTPVELETELNVKSTTKTTELLTLRDKHGVLLDERVKEVEEDNEFSTKSTERWKKHHSRQAEELKRLGRRVEKLKVETPWSSSSSSVSSSFNPYVQGRKSTSSEEGDDRAEYDESGQESGVINGKDQNHNRVISNENIQTHGGRHFEEGTSSEAATLSVPQTHQQPQSYQANAGPLRSSSSAFNSNLQHSSHHVPSQPLLPENDAVHFDVPHSKSNFHYSHNNNNNLQSSQAILIPNNVGNHPCNSLSQRYPPLATDHCVATQPVRFTYETFV